MRSDTEHIWHEQVEAVIGATYGKHSSHSGERGS